MVSKIKISGLVATILVAPVIGVGSDVFAAGTMPEGFADSLFYDCVLRNFRNDFPSETVENGILTDAQLAMITKVLCATSPNTGQNFPVNFTGPVNTSGLDKLTGLKNLGLSGLNVSTINVSENTALESLAVVDANLSSIDLSSNTGLTSLMLDGNNFEVIDISRNTSLKNFSASENLLSEIDLSNNTALEHLTLYRNNLSSLDLSNKPALIDVYIAENQIFDFSFLEDTTISDSVKIYAQEKKIATSQTDFILPQLFNQVRVPDFASGNAFSTRESTSTTFDTDEEFTLENASLSADGRTLSFIDASQPASITVNGGAADGSKLIITYTGAPTNDIKTPNTGGSTKNGSEDLTDTSVLLLQASLAVLGIGLVVGFARHRYATRGLRGWKR